MKVKEESEKACLNSTFKQQRAWHLVPSFHGKWIGKQRKQLHTIFLGSKITVDGDCSHEIKRCLHLERKAEIPKQCIKKQRHHIADKGPYSQHD